MNNPLWLSIFAKEQVDKYGEDEEIIVAIEELSELQKELTKVLRCNGNRNNIIEEMGDVIITMEEIATIFRIQDWELEEAVQKKVERERSKRDEDDMTYIYANDEKMFINKE